jgi:predicted glutamine amidotransferase
MCRFLLVQSDKPIQQSPILKEFVVMSERSRTVDGDRQEDGWGVAWKDNVGMWQSRTSLKPIWDQTHWIDEVPDTTTLAVHARSASFPQHKGVLEYNQPYLNNNDCFVFNGSLRGVRLPFNVQGSIGAQKIFALIEGELESCGPEKAMMNVYRLLTTNTQEIIGMNIGLMVNDVLYAVSEYTRNPEYFKLHFTKDADRVMVCSEPIGDYEWKTMEKGRVMTFSMS